MSDNTFRSALFFATAGLKSVGLLCLTFFVTPWLLRLIGPEAFGTFKAMMELYGHLSLLEFGLFTALMISFISQGPQARHEERASLLSAGLRLYLWPVLWTLLASAALLPFLPRILGASELPVRGPFLLIMATAYFIPTQAHRAYLEATNQGHRVNLAMLGQNLAFMAASLVFAVLGWGFYAQAMATLLSGALGAAMVRGQARRLLPTLGSPDHLDVWRERLRKNQRPQVLNDLASKLSLNCDQLIIAFLLGPLEVTRVFLGQRVLIIVQGQLQALGQAAQASLGVLYHEEHAKFRSRMLETSKFVAVVACAFLTPVCLFNRVFIGLWVGEEYLMAGELLTRVATANAFLFALFAFWGHLLTVLGKPASLTRMAWTQAVLNLGASLLMTRWLGGPGPMVGTLISFLAVPLWVYPRLLQRDLGVGVGELARAVLPPVLLAMGVLVAQALFPVLPMPTGWAGLLLAGAGTAALLTVTQLGLFFNAAERGMFYRRLHGLWERLCKR